MKLTPPTILDRVIAAVDPVRGLKRLQARNQFSTLASYGVQPRSGGQGDGMKDWRPRRLTRWTEGRFRETAADRAEDLVNNDPYAAGAVNSMAVNVVGSGLKPQSKPKRKRLGLTDSQVTEFQESAEWAWKLFSAKADAVGWMTFDQILYVNFKCMLIRGDMVNLQIMKKRPGARFNLCYQVVDPLRLKTPADKTDNLNIRDGVEYGPDGPEFYWIADSRDGMLQGLSSADFKRYPAMQGHRHVCFHRFFNEDVNQVRGKTVLQSAMKTFRDLSDYLEYELIANIITASFPLFIETQNPMEGAFSHGGQTDDNGKLYSEYEPGQVLYGRPGQSAKPLTANRPSNNFNAFVERILRSMASAANIPYEVLAKDFSKTNYSSARAALVEAWKVYLLYRANLVSMFCQPAWEQLLEEAYLLGMLAIPPGAPDFYEAREEWCNAYWIGPARGTVDANKEAAAAGLNLNNNLATLADLVPEMTGQDWESSMEQRAREKQKAKELGLVEVAPNDA